MAKMTKAEKDLHAAVDLEARMKRWREKFLEMVMDLNLVAQNYPEFVTVHFKKLENADYVAEFNFQDERSGPFKHTLNQGVLGDWAVDSIVMEIQDYECKLLTAQRKVALRLGALSKLTDDEKEALGVK